MARLLLGQSYGSAKSRSIAHQVKPPRLVLGDGRNDRRSPLGPCRAAPNLAAAAVARAAPRRSRAGGVLGAVALLVWYVAANTSRNLAARHIATGFGFLFHSAPIPIGELPIPYTPSVSTYGRALLIGILNTLKVAVVGCVLATILGTLIGIGRLSRNWLLARLAASYVELLRDTPLLLQLFFWYGLLQTLPPPRQALHPIAGVFLSIRGIKLPSLAWQPAYTWVLLAFGFGLIATIVWARLSARRRVAGVRPPVWPIALRSWSDCRWRSGAWLGRRSGSTCRCCTSSIFRVG